MNEKHFWTINIKRWKNKTHEEKMNTIWFLFKWFIIFSILNTALDLYKNYSILQQSGLI